MKIFSFFSGAGFLDLGFESEGYDIVYVNEVHPPFLRAYKYARQQLDTPEPELGYFEGDIQELISGQQMQTLRQQIKTLHSTNNLVGFIGGPPCPDFSVAGKNKGRQGDKGKLSASYIELICKLRPDFFLFENVRGLWRTKRHRAFYEELKQQLHIAGYHTTERLINAIEYGTPQDRDRIILLGFHSRIDSTLSAQKDGGTIKDSSFDWLAATKFPNRSAFTNYIWPDKDNFGEGTTKTAPEGIPLELTVEHWFRKNQVTNHPNGQHSFRPRAGLKRFKVIEEGDDSRKSYKRLHRWRYSPTAAYGNNEVHLHPYQARRISAAEAMAIQSLPIDFILPPDMTLTNMFKTIGNGVPYLAAKGLASSITTFLGNIHETHSLQFSQSNRPATQEFGLQLRLF